MAARKRAEEPKGRPESAVDKAALRKAGKSLTFSRIIDGQLAPGLQCLVSIEPRPGDRWRVTLHDNYLLGDSICHVEDIHSDSDSPLELLRLALNSYRDHRGLPEPCATTNQTCLTDVAGIID